MEPSEVRRAVDAAGATASALGLEVGDAVVVHNSDRIAVRLVPCDVLARVAPMALHDGRDRELISDTLRRVSAAISGRGSVEQLLHGEPHPVNVLSTRRGPLFIDVGTCQRGPVEYDLAYVPEKVAEHYPGADQDLVHQFRILVWAGVATMRWNRHDQFPNRDYWRIEALNQLRAALHRYGQG